MVSWAAPTQPAGCAAPTAHHIFFETILSVLRLNVSVLKSTLGTLVRKHGVFRETASFESICNTQWVTHQKLKWKPTNNQIPVS